MCYDGAFIDWWMVGNGGVRFGRMKGSKNWHWKGVGEVKGGLSIDVVDWMEEVKGKDEGDNGVGGGKRDVKGSEGKRKGEAKWKWG